MYRFKDYDGREYLTLISFNEKKKVYQKIEYDNKYLKDKINCDEDFALVKSLAIMMQ